MQLLVNPFFAGVGGYARDFLKKYVDGVLVFDPCDSKSSDRCNTK